MDLLWLTPVAGPEAPLHPSSVYSPSVLASALADRVEAALLEKDGADRRPTIAELRTAISEAAAAVLAPMVGDADAAVAALASAVEDARHIAREFVRAYPASGPRMAHDPMWQRLLGLARRAAAPARGRARRGRRR
jgi:hypothetical protein